MTVMKSFHIFLYTKKYLLIKNIYIFIEKYIYISFHRYVEFVMTVMKSFQFDGLDISWMYPSCPQMKCHEGNQRDKQNFASFLSVSAGKKIMELFLFICLFSFVYLLSSDLIENYIIFLQM